MFLLFPMINAILEMSDLRCVRIAIIQATACCFWGLLFYYSREAVAVLVFRRPALFTLCIGYARLKKIFTL